MLCSECSHIPMSILRGTCQDCGGDTVSDDHQLCEECSLEQNLCQVCCDDLGDQMPAITINPGVFMVKKNMKDSGSTIKLKLGDELHITLDCSNGYDYTWRDDGSHDDRIVCHQATGPFIEAQGASSWGKGEQTLVFKASAVGIVQLSLEEAPRRGGGFMGMAMAPSGVTWKATVQVK